MQGKVKQVEGKIEEAAGVLTDSNKLKLKGKVKATEGKLQDNLGKAKEALHKETK